MVTSPPARPPPARPPTPMRGKTGPTPAARRRRAYKDRVEPHWFAADTRFWYRNDLPRGRREFVVVDTAKGMREPAFDHERVARRVSKETGKDVAADRLPVDSIEFADGGKSVLLKGTGGPWSLDLASYAVARSRGEDAQPTTQASGDRLTAGRTPRPSCRTGVDTEVTFVNQTKAGVEIFWLDEAGERKSYGMLAAGERHARAHVRRPRLARRDARGAGVGGL